MGGFPTVYFQAHQPGIGHLAQDQEWAEGDQPTSASDDTFGRHETQTAPPEGRTVCVRTAAFAVAPWSVLVA
jgi:hypothetical protein